LVSCTLLKVFIKYVEFGLQLFYWEFLCLCPSKKLVYNFLLCVLIKFRYITLTSYMSLVVFYSFLFCGIVWGPLVFFLKDLVEFNSETIWSLAFLSWDILLFLLPHSSLQICLGLYFPLVNLGRPYVFRNLSMYSRFSSLLVVFPKDFLNFVGICCDNITHHSVFLIGELRLLTFRVIVERYVVIPIILLFCDTCFFLNPYLLIYISWNLFFPVFSW
jgi:hypothetical protein